ncbi:MAG: LamG domain-containing protein [Pirellulaceae bacterium]
MYLQTMAALLTIVLASKCLRAEEGLRDSVTWRLDRLQSIGGHKVRREGEPRVIETSQGKAIAFDGKDDGLFLDVHPLAGAKEFTVEVIFRPDAGGPAEQRFFHMQQDDSEDRVMFETRLTDDGRWFLDTFIKTGEGNHTLFAEEFKHPVGRWYHAAIVVEGDQMRHYVNGKQELSSKIDYKPQRAGATSLGVRLNKVHWFQGAIRTARFTPRALDPADFLTP